MDQSGAIATGSCSPRLLSEDIKIKTFRPILIFSAFLLCGFENWFPKLRKEHRLKMFENRMGRKILGPKREEEGGGWRKLHAEELQVDDFYSSLNISSFFCFWRDSHQWAKAPSFMRFLYHTQRRSTVDRTPLDE